MSGGCLSRTILFKAAFTPVIYPCIIIYAIIDAFAVAIINPRCASLMSIVINPQERARMFSIINAVITLICMPFGYIAGFLSSIDRRLPFLMAIAMMIAALAITAFLKVSMAGGDNKLGESP